MKKTVRIDTVLSDAGVRLGCAQTMILLQEALTDCLNEYHHSNVTLRQKYNAFWVVTKAKVRFYRLPRWNETLTLECDFYGFGKLRTELQILLTDADGQTVLEGAEEVCALDFERHRPLRLQQIEFTPRTDGVQTEFERPAPVEGEAAFAVTVLPHMIDMSRHMNNVEYAKLAMDTFAVGEQLALTPVEMELHYLKESKEGQRLAVRFAQDGSTRRISIDSEDGAVFWARICTKQS